MTTNQTLWLDADGLRVGTNQLVTSGGGVGIGTTSVYGALTVAGTATQVAAVFFGNMGIGTSSPSTLLTVNGTATITTLNLTNALTLNGSSSGTTTLSPSATASGTITIPSGTGTAAVQGVSTNIVLPGAEISTNTHTSAPISLTTTIPSWVRKITINLRSFWTNGSSIPLVRIGPSSGAVATGYLSTGIALSSGVVSTLSTVGLPLTGQWAAGIFFNGAMVLTLIDSSTNAWVASGTFGRSDAAGGAIMGGSIALSGALTTITLATTNGTDLFYGGSANILYE